MTYTKNSRFILVVLTVLLSACTPSWEITLLSSEQVPQTLSYGDVHFYLEKSAEEAVTIPLGQMLYAEGYTLVDRIIVSLQDGSEQDYDWRTIAAQSTISSDGTVNISGADMRPESIEIHQAVHHSVPVYSIMDIAPTMASALGLPALPEGMGTSQYKGSVEYGVMILLDGLQYKKLMELIGTGELPFLNQYRTGIQMALTVYPPITTTASASLLTSVPPQVHDVYGYGYRSTETTTLFDLADKAGLSVVAVEGSSLPFNLRNAETTLSGDQDSNGFSDDNTYENSLDVIQSDMPDLLYIHFHEIDDMGHSFGPESNAYEQALVRIDGYLADIYAKLPENTLIAIFADHGMHTTDEGGNHGTLTFEDMIIPILFIKK